MSNIHIPPAALEAGAEAFLECDRSPACSFEDALRAAFVAMVNAWPKWLDMDADLGAALILPLTEKQDDKA